MKGFVTDLGNGIDKHDEKDSINYREYDIEESELINLIHYIFLTVKRAFC